MSIISIKNTKETADGWEFSVDVDGQVFVVQMTEDYYESITDGTPSAEAVVRASFEFLLDNEPLDDIMSNFSLSDIETYFPHYPDDISSYITR